MHAIGHRGQIAIGLDVIQQIHPEIIQAKIGNGDPSLEVFHLDDLFLQPAQLFLAIGDVVGLGPEDVIVPGSRDINNHHAVFDPFLEIDVFVQRDVGPVVDQLDGLVSGTDTVNPAEALDDPDRVPVDVVVNQVIAVLQVLPLGDAVGADEDINLTRLPGKDGGFLLGDRREERQQRLEVVALLEGRFGAVAAGDLSAVQPSVFLGNGAAMCS